MQEQTLSRSMAMVSPFELVWVLWARTESDTACWQRVGSEGRGIFVRKLSKLGLTAAPKSQLSPKIASLFSSRFCLKSSNDIDADPLCVWKNHFWKKNFLELFLEHGGFFDISVATFQIRWYYIMFLSSESWDRDEKLVEIYAGNTSEIST